jgi:hypothetical protein
MNGSSMMFIGGRQNVRVRGEVIFVNRAGRTSFTPAFQMSVPAFNFSKNQDDSH